MPNILDIICKLKKKYEQNYGFAVLDIEINELENKIVLNGRVLTGNQKNEVVSEIKKISGKSVEDKLKTLSDPKSKEIGWATVKEKLIDLKSRFVPSTVLNDRILKRIRASQAEKGEVLRVLFQKDDQLLAQSGDLTLGWINCKDVTINKGSLRRSWQKGIFAQPDKLITVKLKYPQKKIIKEAERFLGTKYILGARSEKGIDCSGLTQCAYRRAFNIILPRHSWDQKSVGKRVDPEKAKTGDLVFMINGDTDTKHVGIWENNNDERYIIHASFTKGEVVRQETEDVFEKYKLVEIRRIIKDNSSL